jgi:hypothetical protein
LNSSICLNQHFTGTLNSDLQLFTGIHYIRVKCWVERNFFIIFNHLTKKKSTTFFQQSPQKTKIYTHTKNTQLCFHPHFSTKKLKKQKFERTTIEKVPLRWMKFLHRFGVVSRNILDFGNWRNKVMLMVIGIHKRFWSHFWEEFSKPFW